MLLNNITIVLLILIVKKATSLFNVSDIYNIRHFDSKLWELKHKIDIKAEKLYSVPFNTELQNEKLQSLLQSLMNVLADLNDVSVFEPSDQFNSFYRYLKKFEEFKVTTQTGQKSLLYTVGRIEERGAQSENFVKITATIIKNKYLNTMKQVCHYVPVLLQYTASLFPSDTIVSLYTEFLEDLYEQMNTPDWRDSCGQNIPLRQELFDYYRKVITVQIKKRLITWFATIVHKNCLNQMMINYFANPLSQLRDEVIESLRKTKRIILLVKHYMHSCDANSIVKDNTRKTYYELEKMIQATIIEEQYLDTTGSCSHNCDIGSIADTLNHTECKEFHQCQYIGTELDICQLHGTSRRYEWFKDNYGTVYGESDKFCPGTIQSVASHYIATQARYCDYCVCTCVRRPKRVAHLVTTFSFREQIANIYHNMVVVGIRFVQKDFMIQVQIKTRKLKSQDKPIWEELEKIDYDEKSGNFYSINPNKVYRRLELGQDYGYPETMNLDYLRAPQGYVITGVRFRFAGDSLDDPRLKSGNIELQIRVTPFDYYSGELVNLKKTRWITPVENGVKTELILKNPDNPIKSPGNHFDTNSRHFIRFQASDLKKDAAQSTVPFFDAQNIAGEPEFPLGAIGIVHKGREGYGGFLTFIIFEIDYSHCFVESYDL